MKEYDPNSNISVERLLSLDFFRGLTMFLLVAETTELFSLLVDPTLDGTVIHTIGLQFHHIPWEGLRFWDLIQPFFMFIVGVAMPFSCANRAKAGQSHKQMMSHAVKRSFLLLFLGWALYCMGPGEIVFRFQNVLAQLSITYLLAFLMMSKPIRIQLIFSFGLLALTETIYRGFPVEGFNHPFIANENFGTWFDLQYGGENLSGHWVSFNAIPTAAHTIWGVVAGQLLMSNRSSKEKLKTLAVAGLICVVLGYALSPITPIIKRTATSTFVIVSGGWTLLALAFSYWWIDIKKQRKGSLFFAVVGMNSLFIYLFCHVGGAEIIEHSVKPFSKALFSWMGALPAAIMTSLIVLSLLWYLCHWLYNKRIFIKI
jgi:predicted acyltransferase